jgi:fructuronate reductase
MRLNRASLPAVPAASRPLVDRPRAGILHLGLGAFHRAHQAVYTEEAIAAAGGDWGIVAVAPRSVGTVTTLAAQDCLFSVSTVDGDTSATRVVGSLTGVRHLPTQQAEIVALLADPAIRVVTLTVTEKAYTATGPVAGLLAAGVRARAAAGGPPLALVSCDNLPGNGDRLRAVVRAALDGEVPAWASFPSTMVDRIVPATTPATLDRAARALGLDDDAAVVAEPYRQWVLADEFPGGRPAWERAGAVFTTEVAAYERLKLRVLNGSHSTLAYLGALAGAATIAEAVALPGLDGYLRALLTRETAATLTPPDGVDFAGYVDAVLHRLANPATEHRTLQIATDGSQKLPQRLFAPAATLRAAGVEPVHLALALAGWVRFLSGYADDGRELPLDDPLAVPLREALGRAGDEPAARVRAVFAVPGICPAELLEDQGFVGLVADRLHLLDRDGAAATVAAAGR